MSGEEIKPGYKRTEVGVIPEDWVCAPLSDFLSFISYGFTNPMPTVLDGIYMITAADIVDGRLQLDTARKTSAHAYKSLLTAKSKPRQNDILLTKDGTLGRLGLVGDEVICVNQSVAVLRLNEKALPSFLKLLLESPYYQKRMVDEAGGSTIKHIYITIVDQMPIGLPADKTEQQAIATAISDVDALLAKLDQLIAKKCDLKQAAMQQLLTGQTRLPGFSGLWEAKQLGDVIDEISDGGTPPTSDASNFGGDIPWIVIEDIQKAIRKTKSSLTKKGLQKCASKLWPKGTLILSTGATIGEVGILEIESATKQGICGIRFHENLATTKFMYHWFLQHKNVLLNLAQGSSIKEVRAPTIVQLSATLPTPAEQIAIAGVLSTLDHEIESLELRHKKTQSVKRGMMQKLLTGCIRLA